jgi:hypothetical protein
MKTGLNTFVHWLNTASPGETLEYHRGFLAKDRSPDPKKTSETALVADYAMASFLKTGRVLLTQRRIAPGVFSHLATIAANPKPGALPEGKKTSRPAVRPHAKGASGHVRA